MAFSSETTYNQFHNIYILVLLYIIIYILLILIFAYRLLMRLLDVLPNFPFTTSETMGDYYL